MDIQLMFGMNGKVKVKFDITILSKKQKHPSKFRGMFLLYDYRGKNILFTASFCICSVVY